MFAYFLLKLARLIDDAAGYAEHGTAALSAIERLYVRQDGDTWRLENICEVAGLGSPFGKPRDGTPAYYISEPIAANDPKGVGPLMMAAAEEFRAERSGRSAAAALID